MSKFENNLSFFHMSMAVHVLKTFSSKEHPMLLSDIQRKFSAIFSMKERTTTFENNFKETVQILNTNTTGGLEANLKNTFLSAFGGLIGMYPKGTYKVPGTMKTVNRELYYFIPILDHGDTAILSDAVTTNPYLTEEEKTYLKTRTESLTGSERLYNKDLIRLLEKKDSGAPASTAKLTKNQSFDPGDATALNTPRYGKEKSAISKRVLEIASLCDRAIFERKQIRITYGEYGFNNASLDHLKLIPQDKQYTLDPYALCWNNGFYYLICKHAKYDNITHYRIDRICEAKVLSSRRAAVPALLKPYFTKREHLLLFDSLAYKNDHPLMSVQAKSDLIRLQLETSVLSVICDYFGTNIRIQKTNKKELNMNRVEKPVYKVTIDNIEYTSALLFAQQQHEIVTVTSPKRLYTDVQKKLSASLKRMEKEGTP